MNPGCQVRLLSHSLSLIQHLSRNDSLYQRTGKFLCARYLTESSYRYKCVMAQTRETTDDTSECMHDQKSMIRGITTSQSHPSSITPDQDTLTKTRTGMLSWHIHQYGGVDELTKSDTSRLPHIKDPHEVLVEVHAASVNQIDVRMMGGYGNVLFNLKRRRQNAPEFPLILGRDFSGVVMEVGKSVTNFKPGDQVWGALGIERPGTHAKFTVTSDNEISLKPDCLSHTQAASIPYVAGTNWVALVDNAGLTENNTPGKRILIYGGAGGMGTFAIQLLKAWGAEVTCTCSTDAVDLCYSLGADHVIDYKTQDVLTELETNKQTGFDVILDNIGTMFAPSLSLLKSRSSAKYVTPVNPMVGTTDNLGVILGLMRVGITFVTQNFQSLIDGNRVHWVFFQPNAEAMKTVAQLVQSKKIVPVVEKVFTFEETPQAYTAVMDGHNRGKTVIEIMPTSSL